LRLVIAGGGTGGHLFPGVAVAEEFLKREEDNEVLFIGTERGLEKKILPELGLPLCTIYVEGLKGRGLRSVLAILRLPWGLLQSMRILGGFRPDAVLGVGGYASGPALLAACIRGLPTAIAEQNAIPGVTNRILAGMVRRIFLSFPDNEGWASREKAVVTGNPIRAGLLSKELRVKHADLFTILVFGGSQGAHRINETMAEALGHLRDILGSIRIIHQTGNDDLEYMNEVYRGWEKDGLKAEVLPFITDMGAAYKRANLIICRAGATSIAEITACGKAAIFIPFPFAIADHQTKNAQALEKAGAAVMIPQKDLDAEKLAGLILEFFEEPAKLRAIEKRSAALGHPDAAKHVVDELVNLVDSSKH